MVMRFFRSTDLPEPRPLDWPRRQFSDAKFVFEQMRDGRIMIELHHNTIKGVTPEMLNWWFGVYATQKIRICEQVFDAYLIWHPQDNVGLSVLRGDLKEPLRVGDVLAVRRYFARDLAFKSYERFHVMQRDAEAFAVKVHRFGMQMAIARWEFQATQDGTDVVMRTEVGVENGLVKVIMNNFILPMVVDMKLLDAWLQYSVEEIGNFEFFLPALYAKRDQGAVIDLSDELGQRSCDL